MNRDEETTSGAEVTNVSPHGIWVLVDDAEHFLPHEEFPWFREAKLEDVFQLERPRPGHLYWPKLDVDLSVESLSNLEQYPLISKH